MAKTPYPAFDDRPIDPAWKASLNCGASYGHSEFTGNNFWHSMVGNLSGTDTYFRLPHICSLTEWGIGGSLDGRLDGKVYRWVDTKAKEGVPWSSGPWIAPGMGDGPAYVAKWGVNGVNSHAEAIEFSGQVATPMTHAQWLKGIWLTAAIEHDAGRTSEDVLWHMHHREICIRSGKDCPFPRIYNYTHQYYPAIIALMAHYEGKPNQKLVHTIAGITVDLRAITGAAVEQPPQQVDGLSVGARVEVTEPLNLRQGSGTTYKVMTVLAPGTEAKVINGPRLSEGYVWWDIEGTFGSGWVAGSYLDRLPDIILPPKPAPAPAKPIFTPFVPPRRFTVGAGGATVRQWAGRDSAELMNWPPGRMFMSDGYYHGEKVAGDDRWLVHQNDPRGRIHVSGVKEAI